MKFSANMIAALGLVASVGLVAPASAAVSGMTGSGDNSTQSSMPAESTQASQAPRTDDAQANNMPSAADTSRNGAANSSTNLSQQSVMDLQQALNGQGAKVTSDGVWGPETVAALKQYQQQSGLPVTGQLDQATRSKLNIKG